MDGGKRMASNWEVILTPFLTPKHDFTGCIKSSNPLLLHLPDLKRFKLFEAKPQK